MEIDKESKKNTSQRPISIVKPSRLKLWGCNVLEIFIVSKKKWKYILKPLIHALNQTMSR